MLPQGRLFVKTVGRILRVQQTVPSSSYSTSLRLFGPYKEPPHLVDTEATVDARQIKLPYLTEQIKVEMYNRNKENPSEWPLSRLAQHYGTTLDRTKAVLFLMRRREEIMIQEKVAEIPTSWHEIWTRHSAPTEVAAPVVKEIVTAETDGIPASVKTEAPTEPKSAPNSKEALASEYGMSVKEVEDILKRMELHTNRMSDLEAANKYTEDIVNNLASAGVDTSFRETATAPRGGSFKEDYYPAIFGDDGHEAAKKDLLDRISAETKAEIVDFEASLFSNSTSSKSGITDTSAMHSPKPTVIIPNKSGTKTDTLSRWKIAFRDLSWRRTQPTMIRSRSGAWREANAFEDALRSWRKHPSKLDLETYREEIKQFLDPDNDEAAAAQIPLAQLKAKKERRAATKAAADAAK